MENVSAVILELRHVADIPGKDAFCVAGFVHKPADVRQHERGARDQQIHAEKKAHPGQKRPTFFRFYSQSPTPPLNIRVLWG